MRDRASRAASLAARAALLVAAAVPALAASTACAQQPPEWRVRLTREARALTFGPEQRPMREATLPRSGATPGIPDLTFAPAVGQRGAVRVAGRITSRAAYPRLGIPQGVSYLWVSTRDPVRMAVVPEDARRPARWFPTTPHDHPRPGDPCAIDPFATQLSMRRPSRGGGVGGGALMLAACTCVNGVWMTSEGAGAELLTETNARVFLAR